jgi:hypothetical protein
MKKEPFAETLTYSTGGGGGGGGGGVIFEQNGMLILLSFLFFFRMQLAKTWFLFHWPRDRSRVGLFPHVHHCNLGLRVAEAGAFGHAAFVYLSPIVVAVPARRGRGKHKEEPFVMKKKGKVEANQHESTRVLTICTRRPFGAENVVWWTQVSGRYKSRG